jgi:hypothetical protein
MSALSDPTLAWLGSVLGRGTRVLALEPLPAASHTNHRIRAELG